MAHLDFKSFNVASWNIQSVKDKLSDKLMKKMIDKYDFVFLTEIKTPLKISCTGFTVYQHSAKQSHRGGVALLLKPWLAKFVKKIDKSYENILVCEFEIMPDTVFVSCYITLSDSPYFDNSVFGHLQSIVKNDEGKKYIFLGDLNSRVGIPPTRKVGWDELSYTGCEDTAVNNNGKEILQLCEDCDLAIINDLKYKDKHFKSRLSFRKKSNWISEPDRLIVSVNGLDMIHSFAMVQYYENKYLYSDHALMDFVIDMRQVRIPTELLLRSASNLGKSVYEVCPIKIEKSLRLTQCDEDGVLEYFTRNVPPIIQNQTVDELVNTFNQTVANALKENKQTLTHEPSEWGNAEKWTKLLAENDSKTIWKSIGWNGNISEISSSSSSPTDEEFRVHFENLLNPTTGCTSDEIDVSDLPTIPVLDDPITPVEVVEAASECKESKSFIGVTPAIFRCLPPIWIMFITQLLNLVFCNEHLIYPAIWCYNKLVVLFKKGLRLVCGNYRGLSIGDTLGKLYAKILSSRLRLWMYIDSCQAGGQVLRGCIEHIAALRLIFDYAKHERKKLFVLFVDFSKAYDRVPRKTLFSILKSLGCGKRFLRAIMSIYKNTINILNSEYIRATIGVKQGGPMSCLLFVIYLNVLAIMLKRLGDDSFLLDVHALMLMDDTVLLASTRKKIIEKFKILMDFCEKYGMQINELKTNLMVVNGSALDRKEFVVSGVTVKHASKYIYLGSPFTEDANINSVIKLHVKSRMADLNKFKIFCGRNETMPYRFKKEVLEAMIVSSLLYGCESWLTDNVKDVERMYIGAVKSLLSVRQTTRSDTILIESGLPTIAEQIRKRTAAFAKKELLNDHREETPLMKIYGICGLKQTRGYRFIRDTMNPLEIQQPRVPLSQAFLSERGSKAQTYKMLNTELKVHPVYTSKNYINERARIAFTRLRLSSHSLKVETGRWSRIAREERLCRCGGEVEDEEHVLLRCPETNFAREKFHVSLEEYTNIGLLMNNLDVNVLIPFVDCCMRVFK